MYADRRSVRVREAVSCEGRTRREAGPLSWMWAAADDSRRGRGCAGGGVADDEAFVRGGPAEKAAGLTHFVFGGAMGADRNRDPDSGVRDLREAWAAQG